LEPGPHLTDEALEATFAYPPGFAPSRHWFTLEWKTEEPEGDRLREVEHKLRMQVIVGLMPKNDKKVSGVYMFGVPTNEADEMGPRLFASAVQDEAVGYNEGTNAILRKGDPTLGRLKVYVIFYGRSVDIPWGLPGNT
jgi:hypothetical protein